MTSDGMKWACPQQPMSFRDAKRINGMCYWKAAGAPSKLVLICDDFLMADRKEHSLSDSMVGGRGFLPSFG